MNASQSGEFLNYISILEKTNQQFGYWNNQYGILIGAFSVLFTLITIVISVLAIIIAIILWKNSKEQKEQYANFISKQEQIIKNTDIQNKKRIKNYEVKLDKLIKEYSAQLESSDKKNKQAINNAIEELKKEKAGLGFYAASSASISPSASEYGSTGPWVSGGWGSGRSQMSSIVCNNCKNTITPVPTLSGSRICPVCGVQI